MVKEVYLHACAMYMYCIYVVWTRLGMMNVLIIGCPHFRGCYYYTCMYEMQWRWNLIKLVELSYICWRKNID